MKNVLFVDCCIRGEASRTKKLADAFLSALPADCRVTRLDLMAEDLSYFKDGYFAQREQLLAAGERDHPRFRYAHQFAQADRIVIAAPFWSTIRGKAASEAERLTYLRTVFSSLLITGPFSIVLGFNGGLMALNDRLKLRSMVTAEKDDLVFIASEEAAIRAMEPDARNVWAPMGGEPVIVRVKEGKY